MSDAPKTWEQMMRELFADDIALEQEMQRRARALPDRSDEFRRMWTLITRAASDPDASSR